jgi:hypothetical protein
MRPIQLLLIVLFCPTLQSQPSTSDPSAKRPQQNQPATNTQKPSASDERGSEQAPLFIKVLPPVKTKEEAASDQAKDLDQSSANWWMVRLTVAIVLVGCIQTIVFWLQARRLKQTIEVMDRISTQQTTDVQASIAEATRVAKAMEGIAGSMATNVASVKESVGISREIADGQREIADRQRLITELQSRAYLSVEHLGMVPQNAGTGLRFEPRAAIVNKGNTPAYKVKYSARAEVVPFPPPSDYVFNLPRIPEEGIGGFIPSTLNRIMSAVVPEIYSDPELAKIKASVETRIVMWGRVTYEDAFGIARFVNFGLSYVFFEDGTTTMTNELPLLNDSN